MLIYQIVHLESGNRYVGQTTRPPVKRWREHLYHLRKGRHHNRYLQSAWNKYGESAFKFKIIKEFQTLADLNAAEIEIIKTGTNLFNLAEGGCGHVHSKKTKNAIGAANKKPIVGMSIKTREIREYASAADAAKDGFNAACVRKCAYDFVAQCKNRSDFKSLSHKDWVWAEKDDFSVKKLNDKADLAAIGKVRKERGILGLNIFSLQMVSFKSSAEAARAGFGGTTIYRACNNKILVHKGFVWVYADEISPQSLLEQKRKDYMSKPATRGPKSWQ